MEKRTALRSMPGLFIVACAVALAATLCALAHPATAMADERVAHSVDASGNVTDYYDIASARSACYNGVTVVMDTDWKFEKKDHFIVPSGKKVTLDMNGHRIDSNYLAFFLNEHSELVLTSSVKSTFTYKGYSSQDGSEMDVQTTTGGLVKVTDNHSSIIQGSDYSTVTLDGVTVGGSSVTQDIRLTENGIGGVFLTDYSTLNMKNGASIEHNKALKGAGVYAASTDITINIENSSISDNYALGNAGGILCDEKRIHINMTNGAKISGNTAGYAGGGIYFRYSDFSLKSEDCNAFVSANRCLSSSTITKKELQSGGGIHVDQREFESNEGLIEGITISDNYSAYDAGGIELDQEWTTVRNCTITGNTAYYEGGGIYDCNDRNIIDNCTITDNVCNLAGKNYEGGGIYVWCDYDIKMTNTCVVKGNTRGKGGSADDVFLRENVGATAKAYITGNLSKDSTVGVRTGITGDRRIAKNFTSATKDCFFIDLDGYYVSYGTDEGGDAWQRHRTLEFAAKVNGEGSNRYKQGANVTLVAPATKGSDQVFWYWDTDSTTGLKPIGDYISDKTKFNNTLSFKMPQNDVNAVPVYATRATKVIVGINAPVAGKALPVAAELRRANGIGGNYIFAAPITWYEVAQDGTKTLASGAAKAGTSYIASVTCAPSDWGGLCFSSSFTADGVTVKTDTGADIAATSASVDGSTGALTFETTAFEKTQGEAPDPSESGKVTIELQNGGLEAALDGGSSTAAVAAFTEGDGSNGQLLRDGKTIEEYEVSYAKNAGDVTITAPALDGYNFCYWDLAGSSWEHDDEKGTVTVPESALDGSLRIAAVYTPVVTEAEFAASAPKVAGDNLAESVSELWVTCSDGSRINFVDLIGSKGLPVSWSPEGDNGKADYSTAYTAMVKIADGAEDLVDVDKVIGANAIIKASDGTEATGAGFTVVDGSLYLCVAFPETPAVKATSITQPSDVELSFEEAVGCEANQAAHSDELCWPLPKTVSIQLENGETVDGDITWDIPAGFDANATAAQEITVKGTVGNIASEDEIDTSGISLDVSTTIKIAAPSQGGGDGDTPAVDPDDGGEASNGDNAATDAKSASAKTGDSIPVFAVAAIAVVAVAAVIVAIVALRRRNR